MPAKTLTLATLIPAAARSKYVQTYFQNGEAARLVEVSFATPCTRKEAESCAFVAVDGEIVGFVQLWGDREWSFQAIREASDATDAQGMSEAPAGSKLLSMMLRHTGKTRRAVLLAAGYAV